VRPRRGRLHARGLNTRRIAIRAHWRGLLGVKGRRKRAAPGDVASLPVNRQVRTSPGDPQRLRPLEIDRQPLDREVSRLRAIENFIHLRCRTPEQVPKIWRAHYETALVVDRRQPALGGKATRSVLCAEKEVKMRLRGPEPDFLSSSADAPTKSSKLSTFTARSCMPNARAAGSNSFNRYTLPSTSPRPATAAIEDNSLDMRRRVARGRWSSAINRARAPGCVARCANPPLILARCDRLVRKLVTIVLWNTACIVGI
jgi:hypothetical protein